MVIIEFPVWELYFCLFTGMRLIGRKILAEFKEIHPDTEKHLNSWEALVLEAKWSTPNEMKQQLGNAKVLKASNVVFKIKGNDYRLHVKINYKFRIINIVRIGTHKEYDEWRF